MDIEKLQTEDGIFICLTDVVKLYYAKYKLKYNLSQSTKSIPPKYIIKSRGRNSKTYIDIKLIDIYFNTRRNLPIDFKNEILQSLDKPSVYQNNYESLFIDILISFLQGMFYNIEIKKQYTIENKTYDLLIANKILLEFDEYHHACKSRNNENDKTKNVIANDNNYILIRIPSICNYGLEISKIYKMIKSTIF